MSLNLETLFTKGLDYSDQKSVSKIIYEIQNHLAYLCASNNSKNLSFSREFRADFRKKGLVIFSKCHEHERKLEPKQQAELRSLACTFFSYWAGISLDLSASRPTFRLSDDVVGTLVKAFGRTAKAFVDAGELTMADSYYDKALILWKEFGDPTRLQQTSPETGYTLMRWRSSLSLQLKQFDKALEFIQRAIEFTKHPNLAHEAQTMHRFCFNNGVSLISDQLYREALRWLELALSSESTTSTSLATSATLSLPQPQQAELDSKKSRTYRAISFCHMNIGQLSEALKAVDSALLIHPCAESLFIKSKILILLKRLSDAGPAVLQAMEAPDMTVEMGVTLAEFTYKAPRFADIAKQAFTQLGIRFPDSRQGLIASVHFRLLVEALELEDAKNLALSLTNAPEEIFSLMWGMAVTEFERRHLSDACFWLQRIHSLLLPEDAANRLHCSLALSQCYYEMKDYSNALYFARMANSIYHEKAKKGVNEDVLTPSSPASLAFSTSSTSLRFPNTGISTSTNPIQSPLGDGRLHMLRALIRLRRENEALFLLQTVADEGHMDSDTLCLIAMETYDENLAGVCRLALSRLLHEYLQKGSEKNNTMEGPQAISSSTYTPLGNPATRFSLINSLLKLDLQSLESIFVQKFGKEMRAQLDEKSYLKDSISSSSSTGSDNATKASTQDAVNVSLEIDICVLPYSHHTMRDDDDFEEENISSNKDESLISLTFKIVSVFSCDELESASEISPPSDSTTISPIGTFGNILTKYCGDDDDTLTFDLSFLSGEDLKELHEAISRVVAISKALLKEFEKPFGTHQVCSKIGRINEEISGAKEEAPFPTLSIFLDRNSQKSSTSFIPSAEDLVEMSYCLWNAGLFAIKLNLVSYASDFFLASFTLLEDHITTHELAAFAIRCILMACSCLHKTYSSEDENDSKKMTDGNEDNNVDTALAKNIEKDITTPYASSLEAREKASCVHMLVDKARHIRLASHKLVSSPASGLPTKPSSVNYHDPTSSTPASLSVIFNQIDLVSIIFDFRALLELGVDSPFEKVVRKFSSQVLSNGIIPSPETLSFSSSSSTSALTIANPIFSLSVLDILASNAIQANRLDVAKEVIRNRLQKAVSSPLFDLSDALRMYRQLLLIEKGRDNAVLLRIFDEILRLVTNFNSISTGVGQGPSKLRVKADDVEMQDEEVRRKPTESKSEGEISNMDGEMLDRIDIDVIISTAWNRGILHFQTGDHSTAESYLSRAIQLRKVLIVDPFLRKQKSEQKTRPASEDNINSSIHAGEISEVVSDPNPEQAERMTKAYAYLKQMLHSAKTQVSS